MTEYPEFLQFGAIGLVEEFGALGAVSPSPWPATPDYRTLITIGSTSARTVLADKAALSRTVEYFMFKASQESD